MAVEMVLTACAGSGAPNTAVPATNTVAPAAKLYEEVAQALG